MCTRLKMIVLLALGVVATAPVGAQTASERIAQGDRAYAELHAQAALDQYRLALTIEPKNYEALCKASRVEVDLAEGMEGGVMHDSLQASAQRHAEAAIAVNPVNAEGHFALARALGRKALTLGTMDRIRYAKRIRLEALEALRFDSLHAGAWHVLGSWNAEVMRVNGLERVFAKRFLGAQVFAEASWESAQRDMEKAVKIDPDQLVHHLDLGSIYADRGDKAAARAQFDLVIRTPVRLFNDPLYKKKAAERIKKL